MKEIIAKIEEARKAQKMTSRELAKQANLSEVAVYYLKRGKMPSMRTLFKICDILGLEITLTQKTI